MCEWFFDRIDCCLSDGVCGSLRDGLFHPVENKLKVVLGSNLEFGKSSKTPFFFMCEDSLVNGIPRRTYQGNYFKRRL